MIDFAILGIQLFMIIDYNRKTRKSKTKFVQETKYLYSCFFLWVSRIIYSFRTTAKVLCRLFAVYFSFRLSAQNQKSNYANIFTFLEHLSDMAVSRDMTRQDETDQYDKSVPTIGIDWDSQGGRGRKKIQDDVVPDFS